MVWDACARQVVQDAVDGKINRFRASVRLNVSVRTVQRKMKEYRERGERCFEHGNKGKVPSNKVDMDAIIRCIEEYDLSGCNFTELARLLDEYQGIPISSSCLRKRMFGEGILSVKCKMKTRKKLKKILRWMREQEQELDRQRAQVLSALEAEDLSGVWVHPTKPRSKYFGERLEMDASSYVWVKGLGKCTLHVCIDDASGFLLGLWLEAEETLHGYYKLMEQVLATYGIPLSIRTDRRTVFVYNKKGESDPAKDTMTQFAYACSQLGIELLCNSDPDFKPKVERANQTLQGMLPFRFTMEGVHSLEQANKYLQQSFMPYFNELFGYDADYVEGRRRKIGSAFVECSSEQIRTILAVLCERSVNKGGSIQMDSKFYALVDHTGRRIALPYHAKVTVARLLDGSLYATRKEQCYVLQRIPERYAFSPQVDPEQEKPSKAKSPRPKMPDSHPWSFKRQMQFKRSDALMKNLEPCYKSPYETQYA